jgi:mono/diheme cytochrome c family protein
MTRTCRQLALLILLPLLFACAPARDYVPKVVDGDADRGRAALERYECGVCHVIPGIAGAVGKVGPALDHYSRRSYVAGKFPNEPDTLVRWIFDAPAMAPRTAMPAIPMSEQEARDMAAYLYGSD